MKFSAEFSDGTPVSKFEMMALIVGSFVNWSILLTIGYFRIRYDQLFKQVEKLTLVDSLTGIYNRRYFEMYMEKAIPLSQKSNFPLNLILLDIDYFKKINDNYGHQCGDEVLKHLSEIIKNNVRNSDAYVRFGGEEFAILLPNTDLNESKIVAERIREAVEKFEFIYKNKRINLTISLGLSMYNREEVQEFIERVDKALYKAKENGRNQVMVL